MVYNVYVIDNDNKIIAEFLLDKKPLILEGLEYIDNNVFRPNFLTALEEMKWKCVIVPDSEWTPSKWFPTETSKEDREVRILYSYISKNTEMLGYSDRCGWAFHELVHATIFSGRFPDKFMSLNSPFEYPLNTDEIYCYGYQIWKMDRLGRLKDFMKFVVNKVPYVGKDLNLLVKFICQTH